MDTNPKDTYIKHIYWLTEKEEARLRQALGDLGIKMKSAKGIVCTPLDQINKVSSVAPGVWGETCSRQGSWYRASDKNGLYLIISNRELEGYGDRKAATITRSDFIPPGRASLREKESMTSDPDFRRRIPPQWPEVKEVERRIYLRWARRLGSDAEDYESLYLTHTANHANFIKPRLFVTWNGQVVPYSIDQSAHLCSSCVELFQVLGGQFTRKLVAPCPGATIFARLKPDQYLLVEKA
ncbi:MAG: hypothetical protein JRG79_20080 [Deltaproteobacteria bacterium]|nr:hypothetical protein [Deltaproteobacteria bacterium]MBW2209205.1 hypothetical protein [Deltaproteobacteria bacterium]